MFDIDPVLQLLGRAVDVTALRHSVHAANIANANAENFSRMEVVLDGAANGTEGAPAPEPRVVTVPGEVVRLDEEMAAMAQNAVRYQTLLGAFEKTIGTLRAAARDGRE